MATLLNILRIALITQRTVAAVAATVVITVGVVEHIRQQRK